MRLEGTVKIKSAILEYEDDHGVITSYLDLDDGKGGGQALGPYIMTRNLGEDNIYKRLWVKRITEIVGVKEWG